MNVPTLSHFFFRNTTPVSGGGGTDPDIVGVNTTSDNKQVVWVLGDSLSTRRSDAYGPTPVANTVFQYNPSNGQTVQIGATDIIQSGALANTGSLWPKYGINYYNATTYKPVFVTSGLGGTNFSPRSGETDNWSTSSTLFATKKADVDACLLSLGLTRPKQIVVILGINDGRGATALATIQADIISFFDRLTAAFPQTQILVAIIGRDENGVSGARTLAIRNYLKQVAVSYTNVSINLYLAPFFANGYYSGDNLHLSQAGNNVASDIMGRWITNSTYDKWSRAIICCHFDELSTARKTLIQTWVATVGSRYFSLSYRYNFHTTIEENTYFDWAFQWAGFKTGATFTANDCITSNGSSTYWRLDFNQSTTIIGSQNDIFEGIKIKTNRSAAGGATRNAIGGGSGTSQLIIGQTSTNTIYYRVNDLTTTVFSTDTKLQDNSYYAAGRSSNNKYLYKNGVQVSTAVQASLTPASVGSYVGAGDISGVATGFLDADYQYADGGVFSTSDLLVLYNANEALLNGW